MKTAINRAESVKTFVKTCRRYHYPSRRFLTERRARLNALYTAERARLIDARAALAAEQAALDRFDGLRAAAFETAKTARIRAAVVVTDTRAEKARARAVYREQAEQARRAAAEKRAAEQAEKRAALRAAAEKRRAEQGEQARAEQARAHAARIEQARAIDEQARRAPARAPRKPAAEMNAAELAAAVEQAAPYAAPYDRAQYDGDRAAHAVLIAFYGKLKALYRRGASAVVSMYISNADDYLAAGYTAAADAIRRGAADDIGAALRAFDSLEYSARAHRARIMPPLDEKDGDMTDADAIAAEMHERETRRRLWQSAAARLAGENRAARAARLAARAIINGESMPQGVYRCDVEKAARALRAAAESIGIFDDIAAEYTRRAAIRTHAAPAADTIVADAIRAAHAAAALDDIAADAAANAAAAVFMAGGTLHAARAAQTDAARKARKQARANIAAFDAAAAEKARKAAAIMAKDAPAPACDWFKK